MGFDAVRSKRYIVAGSDGINSFGSGLIARRPEPLIANAVAVCVYLWFSLSLLKSLLFDL